MMAHNLCYTTLLEREVADRLKLVENEDYVRTPNGGTCLDVPLCLLCPALPS